MKREEKSALARQRILDAAGEEFARKGYEGASLNTVWAEKGISKGIIYHHFRDKEELYLLCVDDCFACFTEFLRRTADTLTGSPQEQIRDYFDARLQFFGEHPRQAGIFVDACFSPPEPLRARIAGLRQDFDALNIQVLTRLLESAPLRPGLTVAQVVDDFRLYMDFFNLHFQVECRGGGSQQALLREHEERCHRQLDVLLYGVLART